MSTEDLLPKGENLRRAVRWLDEHHELTSERIQEASIRFDLSARDEQFLLDHFRTRREDRGSE